ncbi:MAG: putative toxin-antitoxin system toxin component, PIN family [Acidobacteriota bacterium]|nr:putative toxin-antitoxin system toxin component, PIN family [Acidobacteriota bacterium]
MPLQIVLDTNVLVSGLRSQRGASYRLLQMLNDPRWQINLSTTLLLEYEDVLKRPGMIPGLSHQAIDIFLDGVCAIANRQSIFYLWRPLANDPKDDFLLELAVRSQADFLITYNKRDLRAASIFNIALSTPKEFLEAVGELT